MVERYGAEPLPASGGATDGLRGSSGSCPLEHFAIVTGGIPRLPPGQVGGSATRRAGGAVIGTAPHRAQARVPGGQLRRQLAAERIQSCERGRIARVRVGRMRRVPRDAATNIQGLPRRRQGERPLFSGAAASSGGAPPCEPPGPRPAGSPAP